MQFFTNLFKKEKTSQGIVSLSFLPQGTAVAIANYSEKNAIELIYCKFLSDDKSQKKLSQLFEQYKLDQYDCHLVLTADEYQYVSVEKPPVADNEMTSAIRWKIDELIDFPADNAILDYFPALNVASDNGTEMLEVIAAPKDKLDVTLQQCEEIGLHLRVIDIQETCLRNLGAFFPQNEEGLAVVYLLEYSGIVLIQKVGVIYLSRKIDIGYLQLDLTAQVEDDSPAALAQYKLALEIQRSLDYIESYHNIIGITDVAIIPWGNDSPLLVDMLNKDYGLVAYLADMTTLLNANISIDYPTQSLCAPTVGATLRYAIESL